MRWLEVRRHSLTKKGAARGRGGSHLSAEGVMLARLVGASLGPFASVVTSVSPRAIETALAMGLAVDDTVELPSGYVSGEVERHQQWNWPRPYRTMPSCSDAAAGLPKSPRPTGSWGAPFGHCDGARLGFEDGRFVSVQFRRVPPQRELAP
jgi:hypothetical protein